MPTAYLHIGMNKTGTTSFQRYCAVNRSRLRYAGIAYANFPKPNHSIFLQTMFTEKPARMRDKLVRQGHKSIWEGRERLHNIFREDMEQAAGEGLDYLVSGEAASKLTPSEAEKLIGVLGAHFDKVVVLGLVRPPASFGRSATQQRIRSSRKTLQDCMKKLPTPDYETRFKKYLDLLPQDSIRLRVFSEENLVDGCILQTVLTMMDGEFEFLSEDRAPRGVNKAWNNTAIKFCSMLHEACVAGEPAGDCPQPIRERLSRGWCAAYINAVASGQVKKVQLPDLLFSAIASLPGKAFNLPSEIMSALEAASRSDVDWMSSRLKADIRDYQVYGDTTPRMLELAQFERGEVDAIVDALDRVNENTYH